MWQSESRFDEDGMVIEGGLPLLRRYAVRNLEMPRSVVYVCGKAPSPKRGLFADPRPGTHERVAQSKYTSKALVRVPTRAGEWENGASPRVSLLYPSTSSKHGGAVDTGHGAEIPPVLRRVQL